MKRVIIEVTDSQHTTLKQLAINHQTSMSNYLRSLMGFKSVRQGKSPKKPRGK